MYAKVIRDVCENSRTDFEEGGVDLSTLELLQSVRSSFHLLLFEVVHCSRSSWDPKDMVRVETTIVDDTVNSFQQ